ncbi:Transposable element Tc1 transposase [Trichoplax sp. H2]|nr:Transposable element Tc1 transposase [Trichoplax sp. H2]|eukprot:RDD37943.1 Transposable element Tc1 transposase [Trichoplax sp. H2]
MSSTKELQESDEIRILLLRKQGVKFKEIAQKLDLPYSKVTGTYYKLRGRNSKVVRPKIKIALDQDNSGVINFLLQNSRSMNPNVSLSIQTPASSKSMSPNVNLTTQLSATNIEDVDKETDKSVNNSQTEFSLRNPTVKKKELAVQNIQLEKSWVSTLKEWKIPDWRKVVWIGESKFDITKILSSSARISSRNREAIDRDINKDGNLSLHRCCTVITLWGCISCESVGPVIRIAKYLGATAYVDMYEKYLLPYLSSLDRAFICIGCRLPGRRGKVINELSQERFGLEIQSWPSHNAALNPLEDVWTGIKSKLINIPSIMPVDFEGEIINLWNKTAVDEIISLVDSLPVRINAISSSLDKFNDRQLD